MDFSLTKGSAESIPQKRTKTNLPPTRCFRAPYIGWEPDKAIPTREYALSLFSYMLMQVANLNLTFTHYVQPELCSTMSYSIKENWSCSVADEMKWCFPSVDLDLQLCFIKIRQDQLSMNSRVILSRNIFTYSFGSSSFCASQKFSCLWPVEHHIQFKRVMEADQVMHTSVEYHSGFIV